MSNFLKRIFGDGTKRQLKRIQTEIDKVEMLEAEMQKMSDEDLKNKTIEFKKRHQDGETLDDLVIEAFAVVREVSQRVLKMRPFDVQLMGGIVLHEGNIAEMKTGEGKTLASTLPAYLNALTGKGVHIITVNEYLAERDSNEMRPLFEALGLTVGLNMNGVGSDEKRAAYECDITYGTNNEFGYFRKCRKIC